MTHADYLEIILSGWTDEDPEFLTDHFKRKCIEAEKNHTSNNEFFKRLKEAHTVLVDAFNKPYYDDLQNWNRYCIQTHNEMRNASKAKKKASEKILQDRKPTKFGRSLNVYHLTRDARHLGLRFGIEDLDDIVKSIEYVENNKALTGVIESMDIICKLIEKNPTAKNNLKLTEIGILCYYNNRKVTVDNDIAIAKEFGFNTKKHIVNDWYNAVSGNTYTPDYIERRQALGHIRRLEHILDSGFLNVDKKEIVEKDIKQLKKAAENKK